jgi:hydrogenase small subunit
MQGATDNGCLVSFLNAQQPDVYQAIEKLGVEISYQNTINPSSGKDAIETLERFITGKDQLDVLIVEGAIPRGPNGTGMACFIGPRSFAQWVSELAPISEYVLAVGTCAAFGNIPAAEPNPTDATGLQWHKKEFGGFLGKDFRSKAGLPVINISGCPAHPDWVMQTLVAVLLGKKVELDAYNRPNDFFGEDITVHDGCSRNDYFSFKVAAEKFGDKGCLYRNLGCAGPHTNSDCNNRTLWNRQSSLTRCGIPCHGCTNPDFPEAYMPFFQRRREVGDGWKVVPYIIGAGFMKLAKPSRLKNE